MQYLITHSFSNKCVHFVPYFASQKNELTRTEMLTGCTHCQYEDTLLCQEQK